MPNRENFYSEEVQSIMGRAPAFVVKWGVTVLFVIFAALFAGCYFIKYPDIISAPVEITTINPPADLITRQSGLIDTLLVDNGQSVESGQLVAVLESSARWADVDRLSTSIELFSLSSPEEGLWSGWIDEQYELGELQNSFSAFQKWCRDYKHYIQIGQVAKKKALIAQQVAKTRDYHKLLKAQYRLVLKELEIQQQSYLRDSSLHAKGVISLHDFELSVQNLTSKLGSESSFRATLTNTELQIIQLEQQVIELDIVQSNEESEFERAIQQSYQQLISEVTQWKQLYTLTAPVSGTLTYISYWNENQHVAVGDKLASIVPNGSNSIIGRAEIPSMGFGKVQVGQYVNIKLSGYPYMEFGVLQGEVKSLSAVPEQQSVQGGVSEAIYLAEIDLSQGLITTYNKELPMIQQMTGTAEIITEDMRLISRFFNPIISLFRNR